MNIKIILGTTKNISITSLNSFTEPVPFLGDVR